jgi:8-amino-7-oxononanoate synthase
MPDFTSALYLGLTHSGRSLPGWRQLSLGRPALLEEPPGAEQLAAGLSQLQGTGQSVVLPSTLHLFLDVFEYLAVAGTAIYMDSASYPIARWGAERAGLRGVPLASFTRHNPHDLLRQLTRGARQGLRPLVVSDGICPTTGRLAPLGEYLEMIRHFGGLLLLDDTQALGVLGGNPDKRAPYGFGGGGSLRYLGLTGSDVLPYTLVGASLAKAFGVPMAVLSGSRGLIQRFKTQSLSRLHCSPPSVAVIQSAQNALTLNLRYGDSLRARLLANILYLQRGLGDMGLVADGGSFPVQTLQSIAGMTAPGLHQAFMQRGVKTLLLKPRAESAARVGMVINASHGFTDIDTCLGQLEAILAPGNRRSRQHRPIQHRPIQHRPIQHK